MGVKVGKGDESSVILEGKDKDFGSMPLGTDIKGMESGDKRTVAASEI